MPGPGLCTHAMMPLGPAARTGPGTRRPGSRLRRHGRSRQSLSHTDTVIPGAGPAVPSSDYRTHAGLLSQLHDHDTSTTSVSASDWAVTNLKVLKARIMIRVLLFEHSESEDARRQRAAAGRRRGFSPGPGLTLSSLSDTVSLGPGASERPGCHVAVTGGASECQRSSSESVP